MPISEKKRKQSPSEAFGDVELLWALQKYLKENPLAELGTSVDRTLTVPPVSEKEIGAYGRYYPNKDVVLVFPGGYDPAVYAHEYAHRGANVLRLKYGIDPFANPNSAYSDGLLEEMIVRYLNLASPTSPHFAEADREYLRHQHQRAGVRGEASDEMLKRRGEVYKTWLRNIISKEKK